MIENGRATAAYEYCTKRAKIIENYRSRINNMPMMIKTSGLAASLAFLYSKSKPSSDYKALYDDLHDWMIEKKLVEKDGEFIFKITQMNSEKYRMVTIEVMALLEWMKRFADGLNNINKKEKLKNYSTKK